MRARVDEALCIGSSACQDICPDVFQVVGGISEVRVDPVPPELEEQVRQAAAACPMDAISVDE